MLSHVKIAKHISLTIPRKLFNYCTWFIYYLKIWFLMGGGVRDYLYVYIGTIVPMYTYKWSLNPPFIRNQIYICIKSSADGVANYLHAYWRGKRYTYLKTFQMIVSVDRLKIERGDFTNPAAIRSRNIYPAKIIVHPRWGGILYSTRFRANCYRTSKRYFSKQTKSVYNLRSKTCL